MGCYEWPAPLKYGNELGTYPQCRGTRVTMSTWNHHLTLKQEKVSLWEYETLSEAEGRIGSFLEVVYPLNGTALPYSLLACRTQSHRQT
jgi:hypothetical protein